MVRGLDRRGENAANTAILVAIIGGLLVGYILFLPPAEREQLLFGDGNVGGGGYNPNTGTYGGGGVFTQYGAVLVFKDTPGTLRMVKSTVKEHNLPSATIYTRVQTTAIRQVNSGIVRNGVFAKQDLNIEFDAERRGSRNFLLNFNVDQAGDGPLSVYLNGHLLYERPVRERSPAPIPLPVDYLVDGTNTLSIQTGDVGLAFWKSNSYSLRNIQIIADIIDDANSASAGTFSISEEELASIETAQLQFVPECDPKKAGRLFVTLNSQTVRFEDNTTRQAPNVLYSGLPDCGVLFKTDVPKEYLLKTNSVLFSSDGQFVVDRIKLVTRLKENDYPVYYFNLPKDMYDSIDLGRGQLRLTLTFTDYRNVKTGELVINGFVQSFSTKDYAYQAVLDPGILTPGPNTVQIAPHVDKLDVAELKIELV